MDHIETTEYGNREQEFLYPSPSCALPALLWGCQMDPDGNFTGRKKIWWSLVLSPMPPPIIRHFEVLMLGLDFGQNSQCPGGFTTTSAAVGLGAGSCPHSILELLFVMAGKWQKSSPLCLSVCKSLSQIIVSKSCKSLSQSLASKFYPHSLEERCKIDFMAKLCSLKFLFVHFILSSSFHDFCVWEATTDFPCGFLQHYCNNCLRC